MTQIPIKRAVERVPGGMMVVPLLCGAVLATLAPGTAKFFGSFTGALFTGALPILAVFFVCTGASIDFRATPYILKKGGTLFGVKVGIGVLLGVIFGRLLGESPVSAGMFAGISTLAIVASMNDTNGGLYMALMGQYGQPRDVGAYTVMSLESGPFLTMVTLGVAGLAAFPWPTLVGGILPLLFGMLLGNLDREMREFLSRAIPVMIPFFAFALGANLDLAKVWQAGLLGAGSRPRRGGGDRHSRCSLPTGSPVATAWRASRQRPRRVMPWRYQPSSPAPTLPMPMRPRRPPSWSRPALSLPPSSCRWSPHGPARRVGARNT